MGEARQAYQDGYSVTKEDSSPASNSNRERHAKSESQSRPDSNPRDGGNETGTSGVKPSNKNNVGNYVLCIPIPVLILSRHHCGRRDLRESQVGEARVHWRKGKEFTGIRTVLTIRVGCGKDPGKGQDQGYG